MTVSAKAPDKIWFLAPLARQYILIFTRRFTEPGGALSAWINGMQADQEDLNTLMSLLYAQKVGMNRLDQLLTKYSLSLSDFELWAYEQDEGYLVYSRQA